MRLEFAAAALALTGAMAWADECPAAGTITVTGTAHGISTMREEPQAAPQTFFKIALVKPICGKREITASKIGSISCAEGDSIEATGAFSPPSPLTDTARLELTGYPICKAAQ